MLPGRELATDAKAWQGFLEVQLFRPEVLCPCPGFLPRECSGTLASHSLPASLPVCLGTPQQSEELVLSGGSLPSVCCSCDFPKSQSRGLSVAGEGSEGSRLLKQGPLSPRGSAWRLFALVQAGREGLLGRLRAVTLSSTEVGCASWQIHLT